jgi:hypothetical protein
MADIEPWLVDRRIVERNIKKGLISRAEYEKYLAQLADTEANAEVVEIVLEAAPEGDALDDGVLDDDDDDDDGALDDDHDADAGSGEL